MHSWLRAGLLMCYHVGPICDTGAISFPFRGRQSRKKLGIWKNLPMEEETQYRGNRKSFRFHLESCPSGRQIPMNNRISFSSMKAAFWEGYSPCHRCLPRWFESSQIAVPTRTPPHGKNRKASLKLPTPHILPKVRPGENSFSREECSDISP